MIFGSKKFVNIGRSLLNAAMILLALFVISELGFGQAKGYGSCQNQITVTLTSATAEATNAALIPVKVAFGQGITDFTLDDIIVSNGYATNLVSESSGVYYFDLIPASQGSVTAMIPACKIFDTANRSNLESNLFSRIYATNRPVTRISTTLTGSLTNANTIPVTVTFDRDVTGFTSSDVVLHNGKISDFSASDARTYRFNLSPLDQGKITVDVPEDVAQDSVGNGNLAAFQFSMTFDSVRPTVTISSNNDSDISKLVPITIRFSEDVTGFNDNAIQVINGTISDFKAIDAKTYRFMLAAKNVAVETKVFVAENVALDSAGNGNLAATEFVKDFSGSTTTANVNPIGGDNPIYPLISEVAETIERVAQKTGLAPAQLPSSFAVGALVTAGITAAVPTLTNTVMMYSSLREVLFFWNPLLFLFGARRKQKRWGKVIDAQTGSPIPGAKVKLNEINASSGSGITSRKTIATAYTDKEGNYGFVALPGQYVLEVDKEQYQYAELPGESYKRGAILSVKDYSESLIVPTIAMALSSEGIKKKFGSIKRIGFTERLMNSISFAFLVFGTIVTVDALIHEYDWTKLLVGILYSFLWLIWVYNGILHKRRSPWGEVVDSSNQKPLPLSIIRIMDEQDGRLKLLKTVISDQNGRFSTLLTRDKYNIVVSKPGYSQAEPLRVDAREKMNVINKKINMTPNQMEA